MSVFEREGVGSESLVCDPWNGAGTTTWAAQSRGIPYLGVDLNPVMAIVAKAKLVQSRDLLEADELLESILARPKSEHATPSGSVLGRWLSPHTVADLLEIAEVLLKAKSYQSLTGAEATEQIESLSPARSFLLLALFRACRKMVDTHKTSNPTWRRMLVEVDPSVVHDVRLALLSEVDYLRAQLISEGDRPESKVEGQIITSSSTSLRASSGSVDLIVSSPPYCTRIDYAVATMIELGLLGFDHSEVDDLRRTLMGTTTVPTSSGEPEKAWGSECGEFLERVRSHPSRASAGYYFKSHMQYFSDLYKSLGEIGRVLKPRGKAYLVVQDSQYKDVHNDLASIVAEMSCSHGLQLVGREDFRKLTSLRTVNAGSRKYSQGRAPVESVLIIQRLR